MCDICKQASSSSSYKSLIEKMQEADISRLDFSKEMAKTLSLLNTRIYSTIKYPASLVYPLFDARTAFSVPNNFFQSVTVGGERMGNSFSHGSMRSVFFIGRRLMLFSKTVNHHEGKEYLTSFLLAHFEPGEYSYGFDGDDLKISAGLEKPMRNLISGKMEKKAIRFNFVNKSVVGRIVTKEKVLTSSQFKNVYSRYGGASLKSSSIDIEGYAVTVPHFSPHPYMLQLHEEFGYGSNREFQENAINYFIRHLGESK